MALGADRRDVIRMVASEGMGLAGTGIIAGLVGATALTRLMESLLFGVTREIAVRTTLGSSRGRLVQLLLAEAGILAAAGGLLGLLASRLIVRALPASVAETLPAAQEIPIDFGVLAFTGGIAIAVSLLFALIPLVTIARDRPGRALQEEASRSTPGVRHRLQAGLVVSTVMLACILLTGAGLFIRSFSAPMATDAGFNPDRVLTASIAASGRLQHGSQRPQFSQRPLHARVIPAGRAIGGARHGSAARTLRATLHAARVFRGSTDPTSGRSGSDDGQIFMRRRYISLAVTVRWVVTRLGIHECLLQGRSVSGND